MFYEYLSLAKSKNNDLATRRTARLSDCSDKRFSMRSNVLSSSSESKAILVDVVLIIGKIVFRLPERTPCGTIARHVRPHLHGGSPPYAPLVIIASQHMRRYALMRALPLAGNTQKIRSIMHHKRTTFISAVMQASDTVRRLVHLHRNTGDRPLSRNRGRLPFQIPRKFYGEGFAVVKDVFVIGSVLRNPFFAYDGSIREACLFMARPQCLGIGDNPIVYHIIAVAQGWIVHDNRMRCFDKIRRTGRQAVVEQQFGGVLSLYLRDDVSFRGRPLFRHEHTVTNRHIAEAVNAARALAFIPLKHGRWREGFFLVFDVDYAAHSMASSAKPGLNF